MNVDPTDPQHPKQRISARDIKQARVIIADDETMICKLLAALLRKQGFQNLLQVHTGGEVLEQLDRFRPDLLLLDMQMPDISGLDVCRQMRAREQFVDVPVLIQTATVDRNEMGRLFEAGVSDFLSKPINPAELIARVLLHLERRVLLGEMRDYRERISRELDAARRLQCELLPSSATLQEVACAGGVRIASYHRSSSEIGGDIWGLLPIDRQKFAVFLADFTGHGINAALNTFRLHALIHEHKPLHDDPVRLLSTLNDGMAELLPVGQFATFFYVVVDNRAEELRFASAGAPPAIIKPGLQEHGSLVSTAGTPLGIVKDSTYDLHRLPFPRNSMLVLFSDGLPEFADRQGARITEAGLLLALERQERSATPQEVIDQLCRSAGITPADPLQDDTTIVCLDRRGIPESGWNCDCPRQAGDGCFRKEEAVA